MSKMQDTRDRILEKALDLVWQGSYATVSIDEICKTAGVRKGSFYHYFQSKSDLAVQLVLRYYEQAKPDLEATFALSLRPRERLSAYIEWVIQEQEQVSNRFGRVCGCPFITLGTERTNPPDEINQACRHIIERYTRSVENTIQDLMADGEIDRDADPSMLARALNDYLTGAVLIARIENTLVPLKANIKTVAFRLLGLKPITQNRILDR